MQLFRSIRLFKRIPIINLSRNMSKFCVRCVDGEESIQISVEYENCLGNNRMYNACRPKKENVGNTLLRLSQNINKQITKKNKRKLGDDTPQPVVIDLYQIDGITKVEPTEPAECALCSGNIISILDKKYVVDVNPPVCNGIVIPQSIMVGFPVFPKLDVEFCSLDDSEYVWEKVKYEETAEDGSQTGKAQKPDPAKVVDHQELARTFSYTPVNDDIGYRLVLTCFPKLGPDRKGRSLTVESKFDITTGPGVCPFETRHLYTQKETEPGEIRVVSYNLLADIYADQDFSRDVLYPYCPPYALAIDYRKHLILKELQGYHGDVLCLQEVDSKVFRNDLLVALKSLDYDGVYKEKGGEVREGSAIFYRKSKFRMVCEHSELLRDLLANNPICKDIVKKAYSSPTLKEFLESRTTILHVLALEPVDMPGRLVLVANTHLYFHPRAAHIRMIQVLVAMRYIESLLQQYRDKNLKATSVDPDQMARMCKLIWICAGRSRFLTSIYEKPGLIFCGDFNSTPEKAIYEFMTTKSVKEDSEDWKSGEEDQFVDGMNFSHSLNIDSGCGKVAYTNYTSGFHGHLDYIYYDTDSFLVSQVIPQPDHKEVELHTALPSIVFPSDHIAQICDLKWKNMSQL